MAATFDQKNLTITVRSNHDEFVIDLEEAGTSAELLDWIFQLLGKSWITPDLMFEALMAINDACMIVFGASVQYRFCPFGEPKAVNWKRP